MSLRFCFLIVLGTIGSSNSVSLRGLANNNYYFSTEKATFVEAWAYCKNAGMKFVSVSSANQHRELEKALEALDAPSESFWLGAIYLTNGPLKKWYWVDGDEEFNYAHWGAPVTMIIHYDYCPYFLYSAHSKTGYWVPSYCANKFYFICKKA